MTRSGSPSGRTNRGSTTQDRTRIEDYIMAGWADQVSVDNSFATAWDDGVMLASRRTWWRIAAQLEDQLLRPTVSARSENKRPPREKPVLKATGPGQVCSWDITNLYSPWRGKTYKALQHRPQTLRHRPVLTRRSPQRLLETALGRTRSRPAVLLRAEPAPFPSPTHHTGPSHSHRNQPPGNKNTPTTHPLTPHSLT